MFNKTNPQCPTTNSGISTKTNEFRTTVERTPVVRTAYNGKTTVIQNPDFNRAVCYTNKSTEHKAAANSVINRTGRLKKLSAPLYMFALAIIVTIATAFSTVEVKANPYYNNPSLVPPSFNWILDASSNSLELTISSTVDRISEIFKVYRQEMGVSSVIAMDILHSKNSIITVIEPSEPAQDITIRVTSQVQTGGLEFVEWNYTFPASMFMPLNPYDYYGVLSNKWLDYVANNEINLKSFDDELIGSIAEFMVLNDPYNKYDSEKEYIDKIHSLMNSDDTTSVGLMHAELSEQLIDIVEKRASELKNNQVSNFIEDVKSWEANLLEFTNHHTNSLSDDEVKSLLVSSAIVRHNALYWSDALQNPDSPWHNFDYGEDGGGEDWEDNSLVGKFKGLLKVAMSCVFALCLATHAPVLAFVIIVGILLV